MRSIIYFIFQIVLVLFSISYLVMGEPWNSFVASALGLVFWELNNILKESEKK